MLLRLLITALIVGFAGYYYLQTIKPRENSTLEDAKQLPQEIKQQLDETTEQYQNKIDEALKQAGSNN